MNRKNLIFALGLLAIGATVSVAAQSFAQTQPADQSAVVEAKDAQGNDIETNDDGDKGLEKVSSQVSDPEDSQDESGENGTETQDDNQ